MNLVVGSGPAGVSCAMALLQRGAEVTLLDVGVDLEPDKKALLDRLGSAEPEQWQPADLKMLKEPSQPNFKGLPKKLVYGSDYSFRWLDTARPLVQQNTDTLASNALGGLSNAWGANLIPLQDTDHQQWPVSREEIAAGYRAVLDFVPVSEGPDGLTKHYPLYGKGDFQLPIGNQAKFMLQRLTANETSLRAAGIEFGRTRLAVWPRGRRDEKGCRQCQLCLFGCPYELIYSAAHTMPELRKNPRFHYRSGVLAERFDERGGKAILTIRNISGGALEEVAGERLYLGCGAIGTGAIVLNSSNEPGRTLRLRDSRYFLVPVILDESVSGVTGEKLLSLSQLMFRITHPALRGTTAHLLLYTYNELFHQLFSKLTRFVPLAGDIIKEYMLGRFVVFQGYLHSEFSPSLELSLDTDSKGAERVLLAGKDLDRGAAEARTVLKGLSQFRKALGGRMIMPLLQGALPGKSYHLGSSLPMKASPQAFETDSEGRLFGYRRVHVVDSSVLPSIPASNPTFAVMANAYRIGRLSVDSI